MAAVLRVLEGQSLEPEAAWLKLPPAELSAWVRRFVEAGEAELMRGAPPRD